MLGYWDRPEETAEALRGGWMHTGDAGRMDDAGYVYLTDRLKDMIISGGENVYSVEVESVVAQHPDRKSTRLNSSHANISYAVFCLKKKKNNHIYNISIL